jgi:asparagine synthase (glutamine-hydrolysing)
MTAAIKAGIPVLLDGQGGDEALCGYRKSAVFYQGDLVRRKAYFRAGRHLLALVRNGDRRLAGLRLGKRYLPGFVRHEERQLWELLRPPWRALHRSVWRTEMRGTLALRDFQIADLTRWSLPVLLRYEDRNSMAHGIESRVPLVDHRFVEHCLTLPVDLLFRRGRAKRVLLEAAGAAVPDTVRSRKTKLGFEVPQEMWLGGKTGQALARSIETSERLGEVLDAGSIAAQLRAYPNGSSPLDDLVLFRIASLQMWLERFSVDV